MDGLSDELLGSVLGFIPPIELLTLQIVAKRFAKILGSKRFWQLIYDEDTAATEFLSKQQIQRCLAYESCFREEGAQANSANVPSFLHEGTLLADQETAVRLKRLGSRRACVASTTDHTTEQIENILPNSRLFRSPPYWSSQPSPDQASNETLLFASKYPLSLIRKVMIKPLQEPDRSREPRLVYTWKQTVIRAYRLPMNALIGDWPAHFPCMFQRIPPPEANGQDDNFDQFGHFFADAEKAQSDQATIDHLLSSHVPVYESTRHDVPPSEHKELTMNVPPGVIANVIVGMSPFPVRFKLAKPHH